MESFKRSTRAADPSAAFNTNIMNRANSLRMDVRGCTPRVATSHVIRARTHVSARGTTETTSLSTTTTGSSDKVCAPEVATTSPSQPKTDLGTPIYHQPPKPPSGIANAAAAAAAVAAVAAAAADSKNTRVSAKYRAFLDAWDAGYDFNAHEEPWGVWLQVTEGSLPPELVGTYFRNGPGRFRRGPDAHHHPHDGDGLVASVAFAGDGRAFYRAAFVRTLEHEAEDLAGRLLFRGAMGTRRRGGLLDNLGNLTLRNTANAGVVLQGDRLLALYPGGLPYALDPATLATRGPDLLSGAVSPGVPLSLGSAAADAAVSRLHRLMGSNEKLPPDHTGLGGQAVLARTQTCPATGRRVYAALKHVLTGMPVDDEEEDKEEEAGQEEAGRGRGRGPGLEVGDAAGGDPAPAIAAASTEGTEVEAASGGAPVGKRERAPGLEAAAWLGAAVSWAVRPPPRQLRTVITFCELDPRQRARDQDQDRKGEEEWDRGEVNNADKVPQAAWVQQRQGSGPEQEQAGEDRCAEGQGIPAPGPQGGRSRQAGQQAQVEAGAQSGGEGSMGALAGVLTAEEAAAVVAAARGSHPEAFRADVDAAGASDLERQAAAAGHTALEVGTMAGAASATATELGSQEPQKQQQQQQQQQQQRGRRPLTLRYALYGFGVVNDVAVTANYYLLVQPPVHAETIPYLLGKEGPAAGLQWREGEPTILHVVPRPGSEAERRGEQPVRLPVSPAFFALHHINAFEDETAPGVPVSGRRIVLDSIVYDSLPAMGAQPLQEQMGRLGNPDAGCQGRLQRLEVDLASGSVTASAPVPGPGRHLDLPALNTAYSGRRHRYVYGCSVVYEDASCGLVKADMETLQAQRWAPGPGYICLEPCFVPRLPATAAEAAATASGGRGGGAARRAAGGSGQAQRPQQTQPPSVAARQRAEDDGWLVCYGFDANQRRSELLVFDAWALAAGPVARLALPDPLPHGLYGTWVDTCFGPAGR